MKHSPGPWKIEKHDLEEEWNIVSKPRRGYVASVVYYEPDEDDTPDTMATLKEVKANARLIAAAPELLDALINLLCPKTMAAEETRNKAILSACKVISKVTGMAKS